jgi:murein DD-endopeptidase MepM/ murein hydrolase activator NlpD
VPPPRSVLALALLASACTGTSTAARPPLPSRPTVTATVSQRPVLPSPPAQRIRPTHPPTESTYKPVRPTSARATVPAATAAALTSSHPRYAFPIRGCPVSYGHSHHDYPATDMFAARGCTVVAPVTGRVDEVSARDVWRSSTNRGADRGGLSFSVVGVDGVRYYGSHLSVLSVRAGQHVVAGQVIGQVGNTGDARGIATHLHFGISWPTRAGVWWVRRGELYPWPYLDSWRAGGTRSPAAAVTALHRQKGDVPPCTVDC